MAYNPNGGGISAASDVAFSAPSNNQVIRYNQSVAKWQNATITAGTDRGLPSYVPATVANNYDTARNMYNVKASNTRKLKAGLGRATANAGISHHVFIGDSETSYDVGTGADQLNMWPRVYRATLNSLGIPVGGTGAVVAADAGVKPMDPRWTYTGTWSNANQYRASSVSGSTATFTSDSAGTIVDLTTYGSSASFTLTIDGGAPKTVTPTGGLIAYHYTVTGLSNTVHTVVVTTTSSSPTYLLACNVSGTSGVVIHNLARFGSLASGSGAGSWTDSSSGVNTNPARVGCLPAGITPDVVWLALGVNDKGASATNTTIAAALTTLRNQFPDSDVILVGQYQPSSQPTTTWNAFIASLYTLADTLDVPLLDLYDRSGGFAIANSNGLMGDGTHPSSSAQGDWGRAAALGVL